LFPHHTAIGDLVTADTALAHNAGVLHHGRDYARIATLRPDLLERQLT
jgi:predicted nucleic acid-binding protein